MHARIATVRTTADAAGRVAEVWSDLLDAYRATGVFRGLVSLYDPDRHAAVTLTLWTSAGAADEAAAQLRPLAVAAFGDLLLEPPAVVPYELLLLALEP